MRNYFMIGIAALPLLLSVKKVNAADRLNTSPLESVDQSSGLPKTIHGTRCSVPRELTWTLSRLIKSSSFVFLLCRPPRIVVYLPTAIKPRPDFWPSAVGLGTSPVFGFGHGGPPFRIVWCGLVADFHRRIKMPNRPWSLLANCLWGCSKHSILVFKSKPQRLKKTMVF